MAARTAGSTTRATVTTPTAREVRVERTFAAPRSTVWRAITEPDLVARWWGRGHQLDVEMDLRPGGHWRYVEHHDGGVDGFEGRYGEITPRERIVHTFEWDGMPASPCRTTVTLDDLDDGRTRLVETSLFYTKEERDGMLRSGMETGMNESFAALDRVLAGLV